MDHKIPELPQFKSSYDHGRQRDSRNAGVHLKARDKVEFEIKFEKIKFEIDGMLFLPSDTH
jgi:hypothetical protein